MRMVMKYNTKTPAYIRPVLTRDIERLAEEHTPEVMYETPIDSLDPASWYALEWWPVSRIPEAPLASQFLTFHCIVPQPLDTPPFEAPDAPSLSCIRLKGIMWGQKDDHDWMKRSLLDEEYLSEFEQQMYNARIFTKEQVSELLNNAKVMSRSQNLMQHNENGWRPAAGDEFRLPDYDYFFKCMAGIDARLTAD